MHADIAINVPLRTEFTYEIPRDFQSLLSPGMRVLVPFGAKNMIGICLKVYAKSDKALTRKIKPISRVLDAVPLLSEKYLEWLSFAKNYYAAPIGQILAQAIPAHYFTLKKIDAKKAAKARDISFEHDFKTGDVELTKNQDAIFKKIKSQFSTFYPALIHGITGSGKTEIYIHLIKEILAKNNSALFLVPEIGLTPQIMARLHHHFKGKLLVYHSGLTPNQRLIQWQRCLDDTPKVMVGTRSAIFCPLENLGLIVIDEEHDSSYKQEERFRYHARDLALSRAQISKIPVVLGSATPSLESYYLAKQSKYSYFELNERVGVAQLPQIRLIDFGKEKEQTRLPLLVSRAIHDAIDACIAGKQQAMIFVGQRGYAQNAWCLSCQTIQVCPNCSVGLKFHKHENVLRCHYCAFFSDFNERCMVCQEKALTLLGFGTQSIEDEIRTMHSGLRIARLDSDAADTPQKIHEILHDFFTGKTDLLIGTQMITKGHDFHNVGFVGVVGIDAHLGLPDFRASERSFQSLVQVAGRCGRRDKRGIVVVQSLMPQHMSLRHGILQDYKNFAEEELQLRESLGYPPFSRLVQFKFLSSHEGRLKDFMASWKFFLNEIGKKYPSRDIQILGPTEMPVAKIRGKFRHHVIFKIRRGLKAREFVEYVLQDIEARKVSGIQTQVDVDAMSLL